MATIYEQDLDKNAANYTPLSPLSFLRRAATLYPDYCAVIHGERRFTWRETYQRCRRLASALHQRGIGRGDTVSVLLPNTAEMFEAHFAIPMAGAVLNAINTRLDAASVRFILEHAEARALIVDPELAPIAIDALKKLNRDLWVIVTEEEGYPPSSALYDLQFSVISYNELLQQGDADFNWQLPDDEWQAISLNYTSGTTGNPKGVVYHHRGAYLNAANNALTWNMGMHPRYLWTLPMFHCNGWCFPWTLAVTIGTTICLRHVREEKIFAAIKQHRATHFCGAPVVLNMLVNADPALKDGIDHQVQVMTGGAAPPAAVIAGMEKLGMKVTQVYGLTETYGPMVVSAWQSRWDDRDFDDKCQLMARQGIPSVLAEDLMVADPDTMQPVPWDGATQGEVMMRGNIVMRGYLKNPTASAECFRGGWFHSGDIAVRHPDGYIQIKDRSKDIIISGGENISSIEVEDVLFRHPAVLEAAVVAMPDEKWGESPCAFVTTKAGLTVTEQEIIDYCRAHLAHFKAPKKVIFGPLEKTSTGKVQKYILRKRVTE